MSSFVTNNNTRYTKRARVTHTHNDRTNNVVGAVPFKPLNNKIDLTLNGRKPQLVETSIGSHNSKGLVIIGGSAGQDRNQPSNPDSRNIPGGSSGIGGVGVTSDTIAYPPYPVSFIGPGYLKFQDEIGVPSIRGNVEINGSLIVMGSITNENGTVGAAEPEIVAFSPVIEDSAGALLDGVTAVGLYENKSDEIEGDYFELRISWTGKTLITGSNTMRIVGFPFTDYLTDTIIVVPSPEGVISSEIGGYTVMTVRGGGDNGFHLKTHSPTRGGNPDSLVGTNFLDTGSLFVSGHLTRA